MSILHFYFVIEWRSTIQFEARTYDLICLKLCRIGLLCMSPPEFVQVHSDSLCVHRFLWCIDCSTDVRGGAPQVWAADSIRSESTR